MVEVPGLYVSRQTLAAFARDLGGALGLQRAVETGTYRGDTAAELARVFPEVVTIELSPELSRDAAARLAPFAPRVRVLPGDSALLLHDVTAEKVPSFYFLDGHWS